MVSAMIRSLCGLLLIAVQCHIHDGYELSDTRFLAGMSANMVQCAVNFIYAAENDADGGRAEYMSKITKICKSLTNEESTIILPTISIVAGEADYNKLFVDYISKNKPLMGHQSAPHYTSQQMAASCGLNLSYPCPEIEVMIVVMIHHDNKEY